MRKKDKLYTVNKWNQPAFMPEKKNLFSGYQLSPSQMQQLKAYNMSVGVGGIPANLGLGALGSGGGNGVLALGSNTGFINKAHTALTNSIAPLNIGSAQLNVLPSTDLGTTAAKAGGLFGGALKSMGTDLATAGIGMVGGIAGNAISGGKTSKIGNTIGSIGSSVLGAAGTAIGGPIGGAIGSAVGSVLGGVANAAFGSKMNEENIAKVENNTEALKNAGKMVGSSRTNEDLLKNASNLGAEMIFSDDFIGEDGWFSSDAKDKAEELRKLQADALRAQTMGLVVGQSNADLTQDASIMGNFAAFGGPLKKPFANGGNLFDYGGMSQADLWKAANDLVVTPKANMTRSQYNYHSAYDGDAAKGFVKAIPIIGDVANAAEAVDNYVNGSNNAANASLAEQAALTGLGNLKVKGVPVGKVASTAYNTGKNILSSLGLFADGGNLFVTGGGTNEYSTDYNPISDDYTPIISTDYQPLINTLKRDDTKFNVDDFAYRAKKLHPKVTREQVADVYNSTPFIAAGVQGDPTARAKYIEATDNNAGSRVMVYPNAIQADPGIGGNSKIENMRGVMAHDNNHLMFDQVLGGQHTDAEKQYMDAAYPDDVFNVRSNQDAYDEKRATNAQLRSSISRENNNATGKSLDKIIDKMSDNALMGHYMNQNGYLNKNKIRQNMKKPNGRWDSERTKAIRESLKNVAFMPNNSLDGIQNGMAAFGGPLFALGGDLQTNGGDWSTGLTHIDAGKSHEESPYDGVQVGIDPEGTPNLVEEGETIFDDYVYSNRILADDATKKMFRVPKKRDITYAEISKRLEKEASERPNDPISQAGLKAQMHDLAEQQERQKQEMEAERAKAAFDALSPEEQIAVMNNAAEQEAIAQQAAQEQAIAEQQAMQQPPPEEAAMMQQQMADGSNPNLGVEPQMNACGGKINRFDWGGLEELFSNPDAAFTNSLGAGRLPWNTKMRREDVAKLEDEEGYKKWTQYVNDHWDDENVQKYLKALDLRAGGNHLYFQNGSAKDKERAKAYWNSARTDKKMGYYHYTPTWNEPAPVVEEKPTPMVHHALEDDDDYIEGELDSNVVGAETRREVLPNGDTVIYHDRVKPAIPAEEKKEEGPKDKKPKQRAEWLRYAGLLGPAVGLGMQALGIGKPDYSRMDAAVSGAGNAYLADYKPLGDYLTYRPMDIWYEQNRMNANARATDRAIMNNAAPIGTKMAGLLASGYNDQIASGNLYRQALEYNDAQREKVAAFNRGTNQYNSDQYGQTSRFNAQARNQANQFGREMAMRAATERMNRDAGWYNSIYGNVGQLFKGIGDLGTENFRMNRISEMGADGIFGNLGESYTGRRAIEDRENQAAKGGKLKKRKGFTY